MLYGFEFAVGVMLAYFLFRALRYGAYRMMDRPKRIQPAAQGPKWENGFSRVFHNLFGY